MILRLTGSKIVKKNIFFSSIVVKKGSSHNKILPRTGSQSHSRKWCQFSYKSVFIEKATQALIKKKGIKEEKKNTSNNSQKKKKSETK